jgi:L-serine dehydratase
MQSIRKIFTVGRGPSSSHTIAPERAAKLFLKKLNQKPSKILIHLYGSLATTGKGHNTDKVLSETLQDIPTDIRWHCNENLPEHPNGMEFEAFDQKNQLIKSWRVYSIGGGQLAEDHGVIDDNATIIYPAQYFSDIIDWCTENQQPIWQFAYQHERENLHDFLGYIWEVMQKVISEGLYKEGYLPGSLKLTRRASKMLANSGSFSDTYKSLTCLSAYALAVAEENASGGRVVTAPTCGSAGVLPSVMYYFHMHYNISKRDILYGLATAGLVGSAVSGKASISGAQVGCQGEIGTVCAMAAAGAAQFLGGNIYHIEYAAEMALEHFLGLTCDPVAGLVQVPCIERNAFAATRALECAVYSISTDGEHVISFDDVIGVMNTTGRDLQAKYRETALGGLADLMRKRLLPK